MSQETTKKSANFPGLVDLVRVESGRVCYMVLNDDELQIAEEYEIDGIKHIPPEQGHLPFLLPRAEEVMRHFGNEDDRKLFEDILTYLKRFSYLPEPMLYIIACKVFLTYIHDHPDIHYMPMILFFAVPERGKSRTGKSATYICYRGVHVVDVREANLFRYAEDMQATLFLDIMDVWKKAQQSKSGDILLMRYEKGATVARVLYPDRGAFADTKHYKVYGSTIIATNEPLHRILDSRCIPIEMPNRPGTYENPTEELGLELKEKLTAWRARMLNQRLTEIEPVTGISGRLWDIAKPLLQVCQLVYPEGMEQLISALHDIAEQRTRDKRQTTEGEILEALKELSPPTVSEWTVETKDLLEKMNEQRLEQYKLTSQGIGRRLQAMGIRTKRPHGYSRIYLNKAEFELLCKQYGIPEAIVRHTLAQTLPNSTTLPEVTDEALYLDTDEYGNRYNIEFLPPGAADTEQEKLH
jgi:hypothetical protein